MKFLKIKNKGELDIRLVALMGGTTKANDTFKIGQFGTGLKYTLTYLLRNNIQFVVFIGNRPVRIKTVQEEISGQPFEIVYIDDQRTSITTQMGTDWKAWMIVRELWSNALDEGEAEKEITTELHSQEGYTTFYIQLTNEIEQVVKNWDEYFIHNREPDFKSDYFNAKIYKNAGCLKLYKQGVLIYKDEKINALYSYDLPNAAINELREFRGVATAEVAKIIQKIDSKGCKHFLEQVSKSNDEDKYFEGSIDYKFWDGNFGNTYKEVIGNAKIIYMEAVKNMEARGMDVDISSYLVLPKRMYDALTHKFEGIGALKVAQATHTFIEKHDKDTEFKIKQAMAILETCNYTIHPEAKFVFGFFEDRRRWASVNLETKEIFISDELKEKSLFDICTTLIEENEHLITQFQDCSRDFQQHFIDKYTSLLFKVNDVKL